MEKQKRKALVVARLSRAARTESGFSTVLVHFIFWRPPPFYISVISAMLGPQRQFEQRYRFGGKAKGKGKGKRTAWDPYFSEAPAKKGRSDGGNSALQKEIAALKAAFESR